MQNSGHITISSKCVFIVNGNNELFLAQTKGKLQISTASDVEKHLSTAQIQDWRNPDFQKYKVSTNG